MPKIVPTEILNPSPLQSQPPRLGIAFRYRFAFIAEHPDWMFPNLLAYRHDGFAIEWHPDGLSRLGLVSMGVIVSGLAYWLIRESMFKPINQA